MGWRWYIMTVHETGVTIPTQSSAATSVTSVTVMYLQSVVLILSFLTININAYRDDTPMQKWSPEYFQYRFFPAQTTYKRRMPSYVQVTKF